MPHKLVKDTAWVICSTVFIAAAGFIINIIIGNRFSESGLGLYSITVVIYLTTGTLASFGLPGTQTRFSSKHQTDPVQRNSYLSGSIFLTILLSLFLAILLVIARNTLSGMFGNPAIRNYLLLVAPALPLFCLNKIFLADLRGLRKMHKFATGESLRPLLLLLLTFFLSWYSNNLQYVFWSFLITEILVLAYLVRSSGLSFPILTVFTLPRLKTLIRYGSQIITSRLFIELDLRLGVIILGIYMTPYDVGVFAVAMMFAEALTLLPLAIQKISGPVITDLHTHGKSHLLENYVNRVMQTSTFLVTILAVILVFLFKDIVTLIYPDNQGFIEAGSAFRILLAGLLFRAATASVGSIFVSIGRPDLVLKTAPVRLLTNLVISIILVAPLGINGVAAGTTASAFMIFCLWLYLMEAAIGIKIELARLVMIPATGIIVAASFLYTDLLGGTSLPLILTVLVLLILGVAGLKIHRTFLDAFRQNSA